HFEEIDFQPATSRGAQNYGWRLREGNHNFNVPSGFPIAVLARLTRPIFEYSHAFGIAVTGGYVYRGASFPRMKGVYFCGDFGSGRLWAIKADHGLWRRLAIAQTDFMITTFGEDEAGELYLADFSMGKIYRIEDSGLAWQPLIF